MRLCFGSFASVLSYCRQDIRINQESFISRLIKTVDPKSAFINDGPAITKLLKCKRNFIFAEKENADCPLLNTVIKELDSEVIPFIEEDKKVIVILTLLGIIQNDSYIDTDKQQVFKLYFGIDKQELFQQSTFIFSDFLGRVLLYTACGNIDNTENEINKESIKKILSRHISNIANSYTHDYQWDISTQTLTLSIVKIVNIFNKAMADFQIKDFIKSPVTPACSDYSWMQKKISPWVNKCDCFRKIIKSNILDPFGQSTQRANIILEKIQHFTLTLKNYSSFLKRTVPPIHFENRDSPNFSYLKEYGEWTIYYTDKTQDYLQQLQSIYQEICNYATPCYIQELKTD